MIFDLKTLIFGVFLLFAAAVGLTFWLTRRRSAALPVADSLLAVLDAIPCGVLVLEAARLRYGNAYARLLLRLPAGAERLPDTEWSPLLAEDRAAARQETSSTGRYRTVTFASGKTARWWVMPWADRDFVFLLNITAQQQAEQTGRTFLNDLSHELRTPIATILTHLEILGLADVGEELRQQSLTFSKEEARRMARLVDDMLELGRLETQPDLPRRPLELLPLVEAVVLQDTPRAAAQQMSLALEAESPLPLVAGNADRLRQVFLNLLDNAFKYARSGDRVTISLRRTSEGIACAVCDTGPGIPSEQLAYVTRRFYRAPGMTAPGSGLGLALVAEILRRHESRLELESRTVGETGTCARFVLPMPDGHGQEMFFNAKSQRR